jgi:hypothetical protein
MLAEVNFNASVIVASLNFVIQLSVQLRVRVGPVGLCHSYRYLYRPLHSDLGGHGSASAAPITVV